ncbi:MAG: replication-relaxation family protein, partial [Bdellovibrionota bacterium]
MSKVINISSAHLNYLSPLLKWRVMDLESLRRECFHAPKYKNFYRIIRALERDKILEGYRDPFNRKKYVYLSSFGEDQISHKENPTAISKDTLIHDIKVSEIAMAFFHLGWAFDVELEHQLHDKRNFKVTYKIIPDALLHCEKNGAKFKIALEVELSRKNSQRIVEKARQYLESSYYS